MDGSAHTGAGTERKREVQLAMAELAVERREAHFWLQIEMAERAVERLRGVDEVMYGRLIADVGAWAVTQRSRLDDVHASSNRLNA